MVALSILMGLGILVLLIVIPVTLACYVLYALPLYQMASKAGMENAWLAWIPVANVYVLCMLSQNECVLFNEIHFSRRQNAFWAYLILFLASMVISGIPLLGTLASLACTVALYILKWKFNYDLLRTYKGAGTDIMVLSILGTIISIVMIVELWLVRNNTPDYTYIGK